MSIDKAPSGKWRARWREDDGTQRAKSFDRKLDAQRHEAKMLLALERETYVPAKASAITLNEWADQWLASSMNLGAGGRETYRRDLDRYILPALGKVRLRRLNDGHIDAFLQDELAKGYAPSSVHRHYRTLRRMLEVAVLRGRIVKNPCGPITPPVVHTREMRFLDPMEIESLAKAITPRYAAWVYLATYGGPRWSECVGLRRSSIDGARVLIAEQLIRRADGGWHRERPKTKAGRRTIALPEFVAEVLAEHVDTWSAPGPDGLVFPNQQGNPLNGPSFRANVFAPACARAGLGTILRSRGKRTRYVSEIRIHDLRHTAVALAIASGAHPKAIQARMGHASIGVTLDRYGHLYGDIDGQLASGLGALRAGSLVDGALGPEAHRSPGSP